MAGNEMNYVNYQVELIPENAGVIDQINNLLITGDTPSTSKTEAKTTSSKTSTSNSGDEVTLEQLKTAAKAAKKDHSEEFAMQVLKDAGVDVAASLGRSMGKVDPGDYADIIKAWEAGPQSGRALMIAGASNSRLPPRTMKGSTPSLPVEKHQSQPPGLLRL